MAQVVYDDGVALFFDGAKDLFTYLLSPQRSVPDQYDTPVVGIFVTKYRDREVIDGRSAIFVAGSDVRGPMGSELVPHGSIAEACEFARDHGGTRIVGFEQVDRKLLSGLDRWPGGEE